MSTHPKTRSALIALIHWALLFFWQFSHAATIQGTVFNDLNNDGVQESCEPVLPNTTISIRDAGESGLFTRLTDADGNYSSTSHNPGNFTLWSDIPNGWEQTTPVKGTGIVEYDLTIANSSDIITLDFGLRNPATPVQNCSTICDTVTEIPKAQCDTLVALYDSTDGDNWTDNTGWKITNTPCSWFGVTCDKGVITEIDLSENQLKGTIPASLGTLTSLQSLKLFTNQLTSTIPDISALTELRVFRLAENQLTGTLPNFSLFTNLENVWLSKNQLTGTIPQLAGLDKLLHFHVWNNQLTGEIPDLSTLTQLQKLDLGKNQLTGKIPELTALTELQRLNFAENQLNGTIPELNTLNNLKILILHTNNLNGAIPDLNRLTSLQELWLTGNQLCQNSEANYGNWTEVDEFPICGNPNITLISPVHSAIDIPISGQNFDWESTIGSFYRIVISTQADFAGFTEDGGSSSCDVTCITTSTNSTLYTASNLSENTTYYWKVRANVDSLNWSEVYSFTTGATPKTGCNGDIQLPGNWCEGLAAYFPMNGNAKDASGNGSDGTVNGATVTKDQLENADSAYLFDGDDYIVVNDSNQLSVIEQLTIIQWVNVASFVNNPFFIARYNDSLKEVYKIGSAGNKGNIEFRLNNGDEILTSNTALNTNQWYHIAATYDGTTMKLYINGVEDNAKPNNVAILPSLGGKLMIGADEDNTGFNQYLNGMINDILIHNRALSASEIQDHYESTKPITTANCDTVTEIPKSQCNTLVVLFNSTEGDNWTDHTGWLQNNTPCSWRGITCSGGSVTQIDLASNNLTGSLPTLNALSDLTLLKLYNNVLTGTIPDLSALTQLSYLHLYGNEFTGAIPELKTLTQLKNLYLGANHLTGEIPDVTGLTNLQYIHLQENELTGEMPDFRDNTNLRELRLEQNQLTGTIPDLTHLTNLQQLRLYSNQFTGEIPDLTGLTNLWYLALSYNQLSGTIPASISQLTNLKELYLQYNQLTGTIPKLDALANLQTLYLSNNQLTGTIPNEISTLTNLQRLALNSNRLTGTIPDLSQLTGLWYLALSYNQLTGPVPNLTVLTNLKEIYLNSNQLTGSIPDLSSLGAVQKLALNGNKLTGTIPDLSALGNVWYLTLNVNQLTGPIPDLSKLTHLRELYLHTNQLSGSIPDLSQLTNLKYLQLHNNQLSGSIPDLSQLTNLTILYLQYNQLSGSIPDLSALTNLQKLALHANKLTGQIPDISQLSNVWYLSVSYNQLSGPIPDLTGLTKLQELYLHDNFLTGTLPDLSVLPNAKRLYFTNNLLTGSIPDLSGLPKLVSLRIQNNNLTGPIPALNSLLNLQEFYFTGNPQLCKDANINYSGESELENVALCPGAEVKLVASTNASSACVGQNFGITFQKQLSQTVDGIQMGLFFDPNTLQVNNLTNGNVLNSITSQFDNSDGTLLFAAGNFFSNSVGGEFDLVTVNFTPLATSTGTTLQFDTDQTIVTHNRNNLFYETENVTLVIKDCPLPPKPGFPEEPLPEHSPISTVVDTEAGLNGPKGVVFDPIGNIYVADTLNHRIIKQDFQGNQITVAGTGKRGYNGDEGPATEAKLNAPMGLALDSRGNLYFADSNNHCIRMIDTNHLITTVAGQCQKGGYNGDGSIATIARLQNPTDIVLDSNDNLYIADKGNHRIRKVDNSNIITTFAGSGSKGYYGDGMPAIYAKLKEPSGLAFDRIGNLYIADTANHRIRKINHNGLITTFAGNGIAGYSGDGEIATEAKLNSPGGIVLDGVGNLYIADKNNRRIRKVNSSGIITTIAGNGTKGLGTDGALATVVPLNSPVAVALDSNGNLYISDQGNDIINQIGTAGNDELPSSPEITDCNTVTEIPSDQCFALIALYDSTTGYEWTQQNGWKTTNNPCTWYGITCQNGGVTNIRLTNNNLVGYIPDDISVLTNLIELDLSNNQVSSMIPDSIDALTQLQTLELANNQLTGTIPAELTDLTELEVISLAQNQMGGEIPAVDTLTNLNSLDLSDNRFSGAIPKVNNLPNLQYLDISNNTQMCQDSMLDYGDLINPDDFEECPLINQLPIAAFLATPRPGQALLTIQLDGTLSTDPHGTVVAYHWTVSDGRALTGENISINFEKSGTYEISLVVTDNDGAQSLNSAKQTITVEPAPEHTSLTIAKGGDGKGNIIVKRDGKITMKCSGSCQEENNDYPLASEVTLTGRPAKGSIFTGWSGDCVGTELRIQRILDEPKLCIANYDLEIPTPGMYTLTVNTMIGTGTGTIQDGMECQDATCIANYKAGKTVWLKAIPDIRSQFIGWSKDCRGMKPRTKVTLNRDKTCDAIFQDISFEVATDMTDNVFEHAALSTGESFAEKYPRNADNEPRFREALWLVLPVIDLLARQVDVEDIHATWPHDLNGRDLGLRGVYTKSIRIMSNGQTPKGQDLEGEYIEINLALITDTDVEEVLPILIYYGETPTIVIHDTKRRYSISFAYVFIRRIFSFWKRRWR